MGGSVTGGGDHDHPLLFSPFTIGSMRLKNRIVFPAIQMGFARNHDPSERFMRAYTQLAQGGAGMIVAEACAVHPSSGPRPTMTVAYRAQDRAAFARLARTTAGYDCRLVAQLHHTGSSRVVADGRHERIAPSAVPDFYSGELPRAMTVDEIGEIIAAFVTAAQVFADCGFDGVELHAAHGHLLCRFLSPHWNRRSDEYGGSRTARIRIVCEIVTGVRTACGPDFTIGLRMPGDEGIPDGIGPGLAAELLDAIHAAAPIDYVSFGQGTLAPSFGDHIPDMHYPPTPYLEMTRGLRERSPVPVIAAGRIATAAEAEGVLAAGAGDLVAMGRALLADPDLPRKTVAARAARQCIYCNLCWGRVQAGGAGECVVNPWWGRPKPEPTQAGRRITVVGGGVAGLEAAACAAERGHHVMLLYGNRLGGSLIDEAGLPGRSELGRLVTTARRRAETAGVTFRRLGRAADAAAVRVTEPELVVLATGARMPRPEFLGDDSAAPDIGIRQIAAMPDHLETAHGGTVVVIDDHHDHAVYALAELLAAQHHVVLLCTGKEVGERIPWASRLGVRQRLSRAGVECVPDARPIFWHAGRMEYRHHDRIAAVADIDRIIWATARVPDISLGMALGNSGPPVVTVGDAFRPLTLLDAVEQARATIDRLDAADRSPDSGGRHNGPPVSVHP
jgi:2,4-dienoyl-CoA reductase-like NADH-dependent reductase (Old Yellow Enzyme family)/thioredoxin reductase